MKNFRLKRIMKDVASSNEIPARLDEKFNHQNQGIRTTQEKTPIIYSFRNKKTVCLHTWGFISGKGSSKLLFIDGKERING